MNSIKNIENFKVTAIIPTYNSQSYIKETICSLLNQTLQLDEIIIIDDNSSDKTIGIIQEIKRTNDYIRIHQLEQNLGSSEARNIGMNLARNPWVLMMDHDDIAEKNLLEKQYKRLCELRQRSEYNWVLIHSAYSQINEDGNFIPGIHRWKQVKPYEILGYEFVRNRIISNSGVLLNKEKALKVGGYDTNLVYSQDWDLWLRLCNEGGLGYIDEPLVRIRRHSNNTSKEINNFLSDEKKILKKYNIEFIERAIEQRNLSDEVNKIDFISVLFKLNCYERSLAKIEAVIEKNPSLPSGHFLKGIYYIRMKKYLTAKESFETVLNLQSGNAAALNNLACINIIQANINKAQLFLQEALELMPNYMDATHNLQAIRKKTNLNIKDLKFTWRELRPVLLNYS